MSTKKQIKKEDWQDKIQSLVSGNKGRVAKITVGNDTVIDGIALVGIDYDPAGKGNEIMFTVEGSTHSVDAPTELSVVEQSNGVVSAVEVLDKKEEKTILHLL